MEWLKGLFTGPMGKKFWIADRGKTGAYTLFCDSPPNYSDIACSQAVVEVLVTQKIVVYGRKEEE